MAPQLDRRIGESSQHQHSADEDCNDVASPRRVDTEMMIGYPTASTGDNHRRGASTAVQVAEESTRGISRKNTAS